MTPLTFLLFNSALAKAPVTDGRARLGSFFSGKLSVFGSLIREHVVSKRASAG